MNKYKKNLDANKHLVKSVAFTKKAADAEKRMSRQILNYFIMKNLKTMLTALSMIVIFLTCQNSTAQKDGTIITKDLSSVEAVKGSKSVFPWNGCHEVEAQIEVGPLQITTTVLVCCVEGLCYPLFGIRKGNESLSGKNVTIKKSSAFYYGGYMISLVEGQYRVNTKNQIEDLSYRLVSKK